MHITLPKLFSDVDFRKSTFESQNILPEVDFQKLKYITGSLLTEIKNIYIYIYIYIYPDIYFDFRK